MDPKRPGLATLWPSRHAHSALSAVKTQIDGESISPSAVMEWTFTHTSKSIVGLWSFSIDDGAMCPVVVNPLGHGRAAGLMDKQMLSGKQAHDLPLVHEDGSVIVNTAAASKLRIEVPFIPLRFADKVVDSESPKRWNRALSRTVSS